ncbi:MAG TPA: hypothetical protein VK420_23445, partial [Longimicrobium sp.]|nr:hypothetical protein [Longimicrobium sp.]
MGVATWLLGAGVALIVVVSRVLVAGFSAPLVTPFGSVVLAGPVLLATRRLGITYLPGVALCVWTCSGVAIMTTLGMPEVARYCVLLPLFAA